MSDVSRKQLQEWVEEVRSNPGEAMLTRPYRPRTELAKHGARALPLVLNGFNSPFPEGTHPRDVWEALSAVMHTMARHDPVPLVETLADDENANWLVAHALGSARKKNVVVEPLMNLLKHKDSSVREAAVGALIKLRSKRSIGPLVERILDRSSSVRFMIVEAINTIPFFHDIRAIPNLKRLLQWKKLSPGTKQHAEEALQRLEQRDRGEEISSLNYSWQPFTDHQLSKLPKMPALRSLDLSETQVSDAGLDHLAKFPGLRDLKLNNTEVTSAGMRYVKRLKKLESLEIGGPGFDEKAGLVHLAKLPELKILNLGGTNLKDVELKHIRKFKALESLELFFTTGDEGLAHVASLIQLSNLRLYNLPVTDDGIGYLINLRTLRNLRIEHCQITDESCRHLVKLKKLEHLVIRGTHLTAEGIFAIRSRLQRCKVEE